jgi:glycosyltransferase involved in cell wall biosynthesis
MKIAVWHNLPSGGGKRALYYHVRGLVERGHQIESWSLDTADHSFLPLSQFVTEHIQTSESNHRPPNWFIKRFAPHYHAAVERMRAFDDACRRCAEEIDAGGFDLLFANSTILYAMPYIMRHVRIRSVLYLQEPYRYLYEAAPILPWVSGGTDDLRQARFLRLRQFLSEYPNLQTLRLLAKQEWLSARACDQILVNSYFSRESVLRAYGVDAKVCYLGVDTTLFRDLGLERERFIVGLGSFDAIKRIDLAVRAVALLPEPRPPLIWIANSGNETYQRQVQELAQSQGVELRIQMAISDTELVPILNRAALLLCTSRLEPFGFAPLEANACGLPVVGIREGGIRETVEDGVNGFLVDPEPECIARAANQLLQNPALAKQMGKNGVVHVKQKWNVESSVDRLEEILVQVLARKQGEAR